MKQFIKRVLIIPFDFIYLLTKSYEAILSFIVTSEFAAIGRSKYLQKNSMLNKNVKHVTSNGSLFSAQLFTPNALCDYRANSFSIKEPETLKWIDELGDSGAFYDIGANIGLYSIYYAQTKAGNVYSFEPSVFNVSQIAKNISINKLNEKIFLIPTPLSTNNGFANFGISNEDLGGALNAFGVEYGHDGKAMSPLISFSILGLSLDFLVEKGLIPEIPRLIKIDVDGIEHLILEGARKVLSSKECISVFVEVNDSFLQQSQKVEEILLSCGFKFREKLHSAGTEKSEVFNKTFNQIWVKTNI